MHGNDGRGGIATALLGVAGALIGGFLGTLIGFGSTDSINVGSIITATLGAFDMLFVYSRFLRN